MKRAMILAFLAFGVAMLAFGQSVNKASVEDVGTPSSLQVAASPARLDFGDQVVETISNPLIVTITNNTDKPVEIKRVEISSEHGEDFDVDEDYEFLGTTIEAGKSCRVGVVFFPLLLGERTSFLLITYDDPDHPQKVFLKGNGIKSSSDADAGSRIQ